MLYGGYTNLLGVYRGGESDETVMSTITASVTRGDAGFYTYKVCVGGVY